MKDIFILLALLIVSSARGEDIHTQRGTLRLPDRDSANGQLGYSRGGEEYGIVHVDLLRGGKRYLVFTYSGWSRGTAQEKGPCGCGWETQINYVVLRNGKLLQHQRMDLESCWHGTNGGRIKWNKGKLEFGAETPDGSYDALYDPKKCEEGFQLVSGPQKALEQETTEPSHPANPRNAGG